MIEINQLTNEHRYRLVVYTPPRKYGQPAEQGRITSWNTKFIFVDYTNCGRGIATDPRDLEFV